MATGGNAIRGTRVGAGPMGEQDHGHHADRVAVSYWDALGNETVRYFAAGIAVVCVLRALVVLGADPRAAS